MNVTARRIAYISKQRAQKKWLPQHLQIPKWDILVGDTVQVISGTDTGKRGEVLAIKRKENRLIVKGVKLVKKRIAASEKHAGGSVTIESPIQYSNVQLICPETDTPTSVVWKFITNEEKVEEKVRTAKVSGAVIPKPEIEYSYSKKAERPIGPKDTPVEIVYEKTFDERTLFPVLTIKDVFPDAPKTIRDLYTAPETLEWPPPPPKRAPKKTKTYLPLREPSGFSFQTDHKLSQVQDVEFEPFIPDVSKIPLASPDPDSSNSPQSTSSIESSDSKTIPDDLSSEKVYPKD